MGGDDFASVLLGGNELYGIHVIAVILTSPSKMSRSATSDSESPQTRVPLTDFSSGVNSLPWKRVTLRLNGRTPG